MSMWTVRVIWHTYDVENGVKHPTIQTKRPLKSWLATAPRSTLFSVLLSSWVESPRTHEYVNSAGDLKYMTLKTAYKPQQCNHIDLWKHDEQWLLLPHCFQAYCIVGLIHPGRMGMLSVRVIGHKCCWKRPKTPTMQAKRPLKTWWAMAAFTTMFSIVHL